MHPASLSPQIQPANRFAHLHYRIGKTLFWALMCAKTSLITGSSRGIGAETARQLAARGSDIVLNFRSKSARAENVADEIRRLGRRVLLAQADLTIEPELQDMMAAIRDEFDHLDVLILNASGGLEKDKAEDYAMALNDAAQLNTAKLAAALMPPGSRIVFVTSHWAHFYLQQSVLPEYEIVAKSKHAGEQALRAYAAELSGRGISLVIVSGAAIDGTITPRLLERKNPAFAVERESSGRKLPTVAEFAQAIAEAASDVTLESGHTIFVG